MHTFIIKGHCVTDRAAEGKALVTRRAFGFSHGIDPATGRISDEMHEWLGQTANDKVLIFPYGKGSTTGGLWILELARLGNAPAGVINLKTDPVIAAGFIMAKLLYKRKVPIMDRLEQNPVELIRTGDWVRVDADNGIVSIERRA